MLLFSQLIIIHNIQKRILKVPGFGQNEYFKFLGTTNILSPLYKTKCVDNMTLLYKYGKYEYLKDFLESGKIRISN